MFESDDFDLVLSQFDISGLPDENNERQQVGVAANNVLKPDNLVTTDTLEKLNSSAVETLIALVHKQKSADIKHASNLPPNKENRDKNESCVSNPSKTVNVDNFVSPKHAKRKIINSYFDHQSKRKFPGPAGLLTGIEEPKDDNICHMEFLSQDIDYSNDFRRDLFDSSIWNQLQSDVKTWNLRHIDTIQSIKHQALAGNLRKRKAEIVTAFVEAVDRSATDPLIILRDTTGTIKCTLHRDAWSNFSTYIVSECCALVLWKPTVLTTGSAFKKHYLNITISNILAIYSSAVLKDEEATNTFPDGFSVVYQGDFTVIKTENYLKKKDEQRTNSGSEENIINNSNDLLEGLDSIFSDDIF